MADSHWVHPIPSLPALFTHHSSSLLRPFARFSISLFRSTPSLPNPAPLEPLSTLAAAPAHPPKAPAIKALIALQSFATQFREAVLKRGLGKEEDYVQQRLYQLVRGYAAAGNVLARLLWDGEGEGEAGSEDGDGDVADYEAALKQCVEGFFIARSLLRPALSSAYDPHILGAIFPFPAPYRHSFLTPILQHARRLTATLQTHPTRPIAGKAKSPSPPQIEIAEVSTADVTYAVALLETIIAAVAAIPEIDEIVSEEEVEVEVPGKMTKKREKELQREREDKPLRVRLEVMLAGCDLVLSLANKRIGEVKARAARKIGKDADEAECGGEGEGGDGVKPVLGGVEEEAAVAWEGIAEKGLMDSLDLALELVEGGRVNVLANDVQAIDWFGQDIEANPTPENVPLPPSPTASSHSRDADTKADIDPPSDSSSDSEFNEDDDDENDPSDNSSHKCPLRSLFALHDRYEEQRLAVWLTLSVGRRGKMTAWMRGEGGKVGEKWDAFGVRVIRDFDGETLISLGLAPDKLDKWTDLAAEQNTKRGRKKARKSERGGV
ncbi:hypothetical protein B9479_007325 [Cryptococcus floricola]|uniref:Uncharacterized protein n=1 Tax=Cryptococcus floricola TaxID=2591691 RepID=A0A5D3AN39_9TREE|nr:hypothetical protein B9479_007325 [Cryptococcus floricola]